MEQNIKVGDMVKVLRNSNHHNYQIGSGVLFCDLLIGASGKDGGHAIRMDGTTGNFLRLEDVELLSDVSPTKEQLHTFKTKSGMEWKGFAMDVDFIKVNQDY